MARRVLNPVVESVGIRPVVVIRRGHNFSLTAAAAPSLLLAPLTTTSPVRRQSNAGAGALGVFDTAFDG